VREVAKKVYEVSFHVAGKVGSSFSNAFTSAAAKADKLKNRASELRRSLRELDKQHKKGTISTDQYTAAHQRLSRQLSESIQKQQRLQQVSRRTAQIQQGLRSGAATMAQAAAVPAVGAGFASAALTASSVNKAMGFEAQLSSIKAVTGLADQEMKRMRQLSLEQGASTKYSALEAAQGIEELLKAGISPATVQAGGLEAALNLATAGGLELAESAVMMSDGLNGFSKDGMSAAQVANILAGAANASSTGVREMSMGVSQVGAVASGIGTSFKEVNATLAAFSNNALKGSDAGTSLKTFLQNVQPDTKESTALFKKFGLTLKGGSNIFFDANGQLKDMADVAEILQQKFKNLTDQQRSEAFFQLFGTDAVRAANILYKEGSEGIDKMYKEMSKVTALDVAKEKMNNAAGAVEQFKGAFETLQIVAAEGTLPVIKTVATEAAEFLEKNADSAERAGKRFGKALEQIVSPFTSDKPEFLPELKHDPEYLASYREELENWKKYKDMDFSDKFIASLDIMTDKVDAWVEGPGGDKMGEIFTKLAEIAANAWVKTFSSTLSASLNQTLQGNVASGAGLAVLANMMTGGLLLKGAGGALKWGAGKGKELINNRKSNKTNNTKDQQKTKREMAAAKQMETSAKKTKTSSTKLEGAGSKLGKSGSIVSKASSALGKTAGLVSKAAGPLAVLFEGFKFFKSDDKVKQGAKSAGGLAGGLGGAKGGAAIGTMIAPGVGTAVGGLLGGLGGYLIGNWGAGKVVDGVRGSSGKAPAQSAAAQASNQSPSLDISSLNNAIAKTKKSIDVLTSYLSNASGKVVSAFYPLQAKGQKVGSSLDVLTYWTSMGSAKIVGAFFPLQEKGQKVGSSLDILTYWVGMGSAWMASLAPIATSASSVNSALLSLAERINNASVGEVSGGASSGKSPKKFALGGITRQPTYGVFGEAGIESLIPWKKSARSVSLLRQTSNALGYDLMDKSKKLSSSGGGNVFNFKYAPVISGNSQEIKATLQEDGKRFKEELAGILHQKERVSLG
jgi:TP901 family phage tail tape measure protein